MIPATLADTHWAAWLLGIWPKKQARRVFFGKELRSRDEEPLTSSPVML